jgi:hypothetical protein
MCIHYLGHTHRHTHKHTHTASGLFVSFSLSPSLSLFFSSLFLSFSLSLCFFSLCVTGDWTQDFMSTWATLPALLFLFCFDTTLDLSQKADKWFLFCFEIGSCWLLPVWHPTYDPVTFTSQIAGIIGMNHHAQPVKHSFNYTAERCWVEMKVWPGKREDWS